jgi:hypothetical protein
VNKELIDRLKPFSTLGVDFEKIQGSEVVGTCPFTGDSRKFFVNYKNLLWDSKTYGKGGDLSDFFLEICNFYAERLTEGVKLIELSRNRGLPTEAFEGFNIGWSGKFFTIPVYNEKGKVSDVRRVYLERNRKLSLYGTPGAKVGLFNLDALLDEQFKDDPVFICEGEWDTIALTWLLRTNRANGVVVGAPGANTFKVQWRELFRRRVVTVCYDNDHAGAAGEQTVIRRLSDVVRSMDFIRWRDDLPDGFDVRDWVANGYKRKVPEKSLTKLMALRNPKPRIVQATELPGTSAERPRRVIKTRAKHTDLHKAFSNELLLENEDTLAICMATILANRLPGDPLWVLLVGRSGAGKTEYLTTLEGYAECVFTAEFTPHTLVSGMNNIGGVDPSLLPKLDNKVLVIKDFTVILSMHPTGRDEIFGQLREAYDGAYTKQFGNGLTRNYESSFGLLAGVTNKVDEYASLHAGLGERFLKYRVSPPRIKVESDIILSAIMKAGKEDGMRESLKKAVSDFLDNVPDTEPEIDRETASVIATIAIVISRLRGVVSINEYTGVQHSKAMFEIGTRLAKQLARLWKGLVMYFDSRELATKLLKKVALGNVVDKREEVVQAIWHLTQSNSVLTATAISSVCKGISSSTVTRELEELSLLGVVSNSTRKGSNKKVWRFTAEFQRMLDASKLLY